MLNTYLHQLELLATTAGVDLGDACEAAGVDRTTLYRWRSGRNTPREHVAEAVATAIATLAVEAGAGLALEGRPQAGMLGLRRPSSGPR